MITFDIIMPVYNGEKTIARAVESLLRNSKEGVRLIIVDDGSDDCTNNICTQLKEKYTNLMYIYQENAGPGAARRNGYNHANADFIMFCDADDYITGDLFERISEVATDGYDIIEFGFKKIDENGKVLKSRLLFDEIINEPFAHYIKQNNTTNYLWNKAFRYDVIRLEDFIELYYSEDAYFLSNVYSRAEKCIVISDVFYNYVISNSGACFGPVNKKRLDIIKADRQILSIVRKVNNNLLPYAACTTCSHVAQVYGLLDSSKLMDSSLKKKLLKIFAEDYKYIKINKKIAYKNSSFKRILSIELFKISPQLYVMILGMGIGGL